VLEPSSSWVVRHCDAHRRILRAAEVGDNQSPLGLQDARDLNGGALLAGVRKVVEEERREDDVAACTVRRERGGPALRGLEARLVGGAHS